MNKHREIIYKRRNNILENDNLHEEVLKIITSQISKVVLSEASKHLEGINKEKIIEKINAFL